LARNGGITTQFSLRINTSGNQPETGVELMLTQGGDPMQDPFEMPLQSRPSNQFTYCDN